MCRPSRVWVCPRISVFAEDFSEFYHLIKSQEDHLPDNYGTDENQGREKLHGYTVGERVKLRLCMSNKALQLDAHADIKSLHGTIVGNGARSGTFLLQRSTTDSTSCLHVALS
ncbi:unnamed protein product [Effrenium voratum]|nr:unnamed protein product [Effrenium voratum]